MSSCVPALGHVSTHAGANKGLTPAGGSSKPSAWAKLRASGLKATTGTGETIRRTPASKSLGGLGFFDAVKAMTTAAKDKSNLEHKLYVSAALTLAHAQAMHVGGANGRWEYVVCADEIAEAHAVRPCRAHASLSLQPYRSAWVACQQH